EHVDTLSEEWDDRMIGSSGEVDFSRQKGRRSGMTVSGDGLLTWRPITRSLSLPPTTPSACSLLCALGGIRVDRGHPSLRHTRHLRRRVRASRARSSRWIPLCGAATLLQRRVCHDTPPQGSSAEQSAIPSATIASRFLTAATLPACRSQPEKTADSR